MSTRRSILTSLAMTAMAVALPRVPTIRKTYVTQRVTTVTVGGLSSCCCGPCEPDHIDIWLTATDGYAWKFREYKDGQIVTLC